MTRKAAATGCGIALLLAAVFLAWRPDREPPPVENNAHAPGPAETAPPRSRSDKPDEDAERETADATARLRMEEDWRELLEWLSSDPKPSPREVTERLTAIRKSWAEMDPQVRAGVLGKLLAEGKDAATGIPFKVGLYGLLDGWPTLRVFLLDALATSDAEMAAVIARQVLDSTNSGDEYAVALRSLTRELVRADDAELLGRFQTMLGHTEWQNSPGFAEAFDMPRFLGTPQAAEGLLAWQGRQLLKDSALHEFTADHPAAAIPSIATDTTLPGPSRAQLLARAEPTDPTQLAAVEAWLKNPALSAEEAAAFLKIFPFRSATTGNRLYADSPEPYDHDQIRAGDKAAYEATARWLADPALLRYQPQVEALRKRLEAWNKQGE